MGTVNFNNRTLYHADNLEIMRGINSNTVHLIATDPPFNKGRDFHDTPDRLGNNGGKFKDRWRWDEDVHPDWVDQIKDDWSGVWNIIQSARVTHSKAMGAFLCFMAVRLVEMRRILRDDGCIFLHCDSTASHYLKVCMDAIFGAKNFHNEIVWQREKRAKGNQYAPRKFGANTDTILFYSRSKSYTFHAQLRCPTKEERDKKFKDEDEYGRYFTGTPIFRAKSMGPRPNLCYEYKGVRNPDPSGWRFIKEKLIKLDNTGRIGWRENGTPYRKTYEEDYGGFAYGNLWTDIDRLPTKDEKRIYPTQKPLDLYKRIICAGSNRGDIVLDPFCGCATTPIAAEQLGRRWVGIDYWDKAHQTVLDRLQEERLLVPAAEKTLAQPHLITHGDVHFEKAPPIRTDDNEVAAPKLKLKLRRATEPWQKLNRSEMREILSVAQRSGTEIGCAGCGRELET